MLHVKIVLNTLDRENFTSTTMSVTRMIISCISISLVMGAMATSLETETPIAQLLKAKASGDTDRCRVIAENLIQEVNPR